MLLERQVATAIAKNLGVEPKFMGGPLNAYLKQGEKYFDIVVNPDTYFLLLSRL
jgi:hypothetical protein